MFMCVGIGLRKKDRGREGRKDITGQSPYFFKFILYIAVSTLKDLETLSLNQDLLGNTGPFLKKKSLQQGKLAVLNLRHFLRG